MYKALYLSPMIPSFNLEETGRFSKEVLGFSALMDTKEYAIYVKDNQTIRTGNFSIPQKRCSLKRPRYEQKHARPYRR